MSGENRHELSERPEILSPGDIYEAVKNSLPVGYSRVDKDGKILEFNPAAERITGYSLNDVIGKQHLEFIHGSSNPTECPLLRHALVEQACEIASDVSIRRKDGQTVHLSVTSAPVYDSNGQFMGGVELFRDITESKRMERERKNLFAMIAHDMKNPVIVMGGFLKRIEAGNAGPLTERQMEYLELVMEDLQKLQNLVSRLSEYSNLESPEFKLTSATCNLQESIQRRGELIKLEAEKRNVEVVVKSPREGLPTIQADKELIDRLLTNLLENALKNTNAGGRVIVNSSERDKDLLVEISDTGVGIPEKDLLHIFDAFQRVRKGTKGTGLGLYIAKRIVEIHGGEISVDSTVGRGTTFRFNLPKG
jgi:two-component system, OmpR family, phosphate regulon sensor histidine kinase PhoR